MDHFRLPPVLFALGAVFLGLAASAPSAYACAACGCSLSADWDSPGLASGTGFKLDIRYDYLNQNQLRRGSGTISPAAASQVLNNGNPQEVEKDTKNDYLTVGLDYAINPLWGVNVQVPYIVRSHSTLGTASDGATAGPDGGQYDSHTSSVGDVKVIGRYQGLLPTRNAILLFGLKLPTGSHTETGTSTDPANPGPVLLDAGLQPGTGTTDVIVGAAYVGAWSPEWNYMAQGLFQSAIQSRDGYRPGNGLNLNVGVRYTAIASVQPQLQLNIRHVLHDTGTAANVDPISTGGTLVYLSPGVNVPLSKQVSVYGYTQLPILQRVNGVQLSPRFTASVGLKYAF